MLTNRFAMAWCVLPIFLVFGGVASSAPLNEDAISNNVTNTASQPFGQLTFVQSAILGVVEGLTEYLPVSSTGHLILTGHFMGLVHYREETGPFGRVLDTDKMEAINSFDIIIQLRALLAVIGLYRKRLGQMCTGLTGKNPQGLRLFLLLLPAAVVGLLLHKNIEAHLLVQSQLPGHWLWAES